jgi:cellulose synthase/poly-beta-1,6-N-acetylglucosamine synthase-like glycosyltransferase
MALSIQKNIFHFSSGYDVKQLRKISIIIPTRNEEENLPELVERIDTNVRINGFHYEIILIDDYSTDNTYLIATQLATRYPIKIYRKKGQLGKAQSLLEGFSYAIYPILCMIDGDLQYPPEAIPPMIAAIQKGSDVVIANRIMKQKDLLRRFTHNTFMYFFGNYIHQLNCDVQSGLKVFRKEIIERVTLSPSPWTFDLEFLLQARDAGYKIDTIPIHFYDRPAGKSKVNIFKTSFEIGISAIKHKLTRSVTIPFHPMAERKKGKGFHFRGREFISHSDLSMKESAFFRMTTWQIYLVVLLAVLLVCGIILNAHLVITVILSLIVVGYFGDLLFQFFLITKSLSSNAEIIITDNKLKVNKKNWPLYTILCPLYKEGKVLPQFIHAIEQLEYPKNRLQVLILLEEDDTETIKKARESKLPWYIHVIIAPHSNPKTKPKALNYGLKFTKGEFLVVYDAEDIPEPTQLKKVVTAFRELDNKTICIQAKLNFYNPQQNILTRIFTAEYSLWFDLILTGLQAIKAPIPLGGTSNHFRTKDIRLLQGWDAFNVTEDCDLGIRLAKKGYNTAIINSTTLEEANSEIQNWFRQRGRWIKGYMQTYLVHMRDIFDFSHLQQKKDAAIFQLIVGGRIFSLLVNPFMWLSTILYFAYRSQLGPTIESFFPAPVLYIGTISFIFGNFLYLYYYMIGAARRGQFGIIKYTLLTPFYWLGMSISAWYAFYTIIVNPHYWAKTVHGLHLRKNKIPAIRIPESLINQNIFQYPKITIS